MNAEKWIERSCRRYGVSREFGERLLPLVQRARGAAPDVRKRILDLVESSLEREASALALERLPRPEERALTTIAGVLHRWSPPDWLLSYGGKGTDGE